MTIGYLAWQAIGLPFCVHPPVYVVKLGAVSGCKLCGVQL